MSSPLPARPGIGGAAQSSPSSAGAVQQPVPVSTNACLLRGGALRCVQQMPLRWLQAWNRLRMLLTP
jgi:hypothetical protein